MTNLTATFRRILLPATWVAVALFGCAACTPDTSTNAPSTTGESIFTAVNSGYVRLGGAEPKRITETTIEPELDLGDWSGAALVGVFDGGVLAVAVNTDETATGEIFVLQESGQLTASNVEVNETEQGFSGSSSLTASGDGATISIEFELLTGAGSSTFELIGNRAIIRGDLGSTTFAQMKFLIDNHPEVDTLVLESISGSVNDEVNVETGRLVRNAGLTTYIPANGKIYSGGVDLFASGERRIAQSGAVIGVHSWCCGSDGESAHLIPKDDPSHDLHLRFVSEMLGPEAGPAFYFFTLNAAPFDGMHEMTPEELNTHLLTEPMK